SDAALSDAVMSPDPAMFQRLFGSIAPDRKRALLDSLLRGAVGRNTATTRFLLDAGARVNAADSEGDTPLMRAVESGSLEAFQMLLDVGADVHTADRQGRTAFWRAAAAHNTGFITMLAARGADANVRDRFGDTPVIHAADSCAEWNIGP